MSWITLQISAVLLASVNTILDKWLVRDYEPNPTLYLASFALVGLPVAVIGLILIPWPGYAPAATGLIIGIIFTVMVLLYYRAIALEDISRLSPVSKLSSVLHLLLLAVFLGDQLAWGQYLAFALMLVGAALLTVRYRPHNERIMISQGVILMVIFACLSALYSLLSSYLNLTHTPWDKIVWSNVGIVLSMSVILLNRTQRTMLWQSLRQTPRHLQGVVVGEQIGRLATGTLSAVAVHTAGSAAIISVVDGIRPLLVVMLAMFFLGEKIQGRVKIAGISLVSLGTVLLLLQ